MSQRYTQQETDAKWLEFEQYLLQIEKKYKAELIRSDKIKRWYIGFGTKGTMPPDTIGICHPDLDKSICEEIKAELKRLFP